MADIETQLDRRHPGRHADAPRWSPAWWRGHPERWPASVAPGDRFFARFRVIHARGLSRDLTLEQALGLQLGGHHGLAREAAAGLLNSLNPEARYGLVPDRLTAVVTEAFDHDEAEPLASNLARLNGG